LCLFLKHHRDANRGHNRKADVVLERSNKGLPLNPQALRRGTLAKCAVCGRAVTRASRQQKYCSRRCRQQAHYGKLVAEGRFDPLPRFRRTPLKNPTASTTCKGQNRGRPPAFLVRAT
jgi:hypothetical protein